MNLNLTAPICDSGYSQVSVNLLAALDRLNHPVALFPIGPLSCEDQHRGVVQGALARASLYDKNAPSVRIFHQWLLAQHVGRRLHVGFPIFELDTFTSVERHHLQSQDLLLVASRWAKGIVEAAGVTTPVRVVPFGVDGSVFSPAPLNPGTTTFLHCAKCEVRKGTYEVIEAFSEAFGPADDVRLILHCDNPFMHPDKTLAYNREWREMALRAKLGQKTTITSGRFSSQSQVAQLMLQADCGLFPSRGEGWNLELSEMLAMGRHCIATDYSGHTEFARPGSRLIPIHGVEAAYDGVYFSGQGNWAYFGAEQKEILIHHMRAIHKEKREGSLGINQAGIDSLRDFTWERSARTLIEAISC